MSCMGDTGGRSSVPRQESTEMPRLAVYALIFCILSVAAAVVSFVQGSWLGIVWVLLAGLSSNMTWYYVKRAKARKSVTG
ncbi:membrane protein [Streptomyces viridochromogenes DSM 40736]|uniref:Membrane protein n=2 Tax=Streptomyces viridochromogenes TaxID=1938 RepID=D9X4U0_STRVT|nr:membrane protein [Streptomyces viridochromogenes DSM 40736]